MREKPIVINICGGPSTGKSTLAAGIFSKMKKIGYNVEYVQEYAKDLCYEDNFSVVSDQIEVSSEQLRRMRRLVNKVDIIITDSPLLLGIIYSKELNPYLIPMLLWEYDNTFESITYFLERGDLVYQPHGRFQTEEQAKTVDQSILKLLTEYNISHKSILRKGAKKNILNDISKLLQPTLETLKDNITE
jgi:nicotinamide riboside kinase